MAPRCQFSNGFAHRALAVGTGQHVHVDQAEGVCRERVYHGEKRPVCWVYPDSPVPAHPEADPRRLPGGPVPVHGRWPQGAGLPLAAPYRGGFVLVQIHGLPGGVSPPDQAGALPVPLPQTKLRPCLQQLLSNRLDPGCSAGSSSVSCPYHNKLLACGQGRGVVRYSASNSLLKR